MNWKTPTTILLLVTFLALHGCGGTAKQELKRDYSFHDKMVKMAPQILSESDSPWVKVDDTTRRKVFFSDRLTLEVVETTKSGLSGNIEPRHQPNDLIGYIIEGNAIITIGKNTRQIGPGGAFVVPSNVPFDVIPASQKTTILNVYTPPREDLRPTAPAVRRFPDNEIKSIIYKWFALFDENAHVDSLLSYLAERGLSMEMADKKKITSWKDFQEWYALWTSSVENYSSVVETISVSFDTRAGKYLVSTVVSSTTKTRNGKKKTGRYQADIALVDNDWGGTPKIIQYTETEAKK